MIKKLYDSLVYVATLFYTSNSNIDIKYHSRTQRPSRLLESRRQEFRLINRRNNKHYDR